MVKLKALLLTCAALIVGACVPQNETQLTLVAQNVSLTTQIAAVRETATYESDQLQITLEYMNTLVGQAQGQGNELRATLVSRGTEPASINPSGEGFSPQITPPANTDMVNLPPESINAGAPPDQALAPENAPDAPTQMPLGDAPSLINIVMSTGVGNNDCATGVTSQFTTSTNAIYVVATAQNIVPGTSIDSRWQVGAESVVYNFTPDFNINNECIWFYIDQSSMTFTPGDWQVQLDVNGVAAGPAVPFSIVGTE